MPVGPAQRGGPIEVYRLVNATGLIGLAGRQHPVGSHFAGRRVTVRLDRALMQIAADGVPLRSLPNPPHPSEQARIRDARPAGPAPAPPADPLRVDRRVSSRGALVISGQKIHVGIRHAGATLAVEAADITFRIYDHDQLLVEVARTTTKAVARFKVRKPEPPRPGRPTPATRTQRASWRNIGGERDYVPACRFGAWCSCPRARKTVVIMNGIEQKKAFTVATTARSA